MSKMEDFLSGVKRAAIAGHVSPDGDCIGSCMGLWIYLRDNYPEIHCDVFMQRPPEIYNFIEGIGKVFSSVSKGEAEKYDTIFLLDISSKDRIGVAGDVFAKAEKSVCLDHHKTNGGEYTFFYNDPDASSTCEVLFRHLDYDKISKKCAEALFMGIVHDTGVFRYSCTSSDTMLVVSRLLEKGFNASKLIDETFYQKTYLQQKILGRILEGSRLYLDGKFIVGAVSKKDREELGLKASDIEGAVSSLRDTAGVDVSMLLYELDGNEFKASFRSKEIVDVSSICVLFGGGGHVRASGCKIKGPLENIINQVVPLVEERLKEKNDERHPECT